MKNFYDFLEGRCWTGFKPKPGKAPYSPGSCVKESAAAAIAAATAIAKKKSGDYDKEGMRKTPYKNPDSPNRKSNAERRAELKEDLRRWFSKTDPKGGWKRVNTKGEVVGDCAREPGEPKPKCMSNAQRASLSKKEKASAVRRKRKEDPNPERQGAPINVTNKVNEDMEQLDEKNKPTNPELWSRAIAQAKSKFDVYPSAYANGWASKWYKSKGGSWKTVSEAKEKSEYDYEGDMARGQLQSIINNAQRVHDMLEDNDNLPEWVQSKITLAEDYISTVANYMMSEVDEEVEHLDEKAKWRSTSVAKKVTDPDDYQDSASYDYHYDNPKSTGMKKATSDTPEKYGSLSARPGAQVASQGARKGMITKQSANRLKDRIKSNLNKEEVELKEEKGLWANIRAKRERIKNGSGERMRKPERQGAPINVKSKVNENMQQLDEKNKPTNPELWSRAISQAKSKFDVYPSAYANGWASKWYKEHGGGWKSVSEAAEVGDDPINQGTPEGLTRRGNKTVLKKFKELSEIVMPQVKDDLDVLDKNSFLMKHGISKSVAKQRLTREAKEKTEYDYEGDMARGQLQSVINNAQRVHDMLEDNDNLPEWVQSKITLAEDYISTVANYMMSELDESVDLDEGMSGGSYASFHKETGKIGYIGNKTGMIKHVKSNSDHARGYTGPDKKVGDIFGGYPKKTVKEEQIDELNKDTVYSYTKKAEKDQDKQFNTIGKGLRDNDPKSANNASHKFSMRSVGINRAETRLTKEEVQNVAEESIDELSSDLLGRYKKAAGADASKADKADDYNKGNKRFSGIMKATKKQLDNDMKKEETIQEGRPSQRHPLEGHEYHKKSDEALIHIAKDAHKAAEAMKGHNTNAENKYRDQANDSATVRHFRKTSGMPEWYKKKYGHVNEAFRPMDEPNYNNSIQARQKKADDANTPPFDGPYRKTPVGVTDKSGAKHSAMSRVRDLAKQAANRQAGKMHEEKQKSRKAQIVKDALRGKDKFEKDPIITDTTVKTDNLQ